MVIFHVSTFIFLLHLTGGFDFCEKIPRKLLTQNRV